MKRLITAALLLGLMADPAGALSSNWSWADNYTTVGMDRREFRYRAPSAETGNRSVHELSARRNAGDNTAGRAEAAVKTRFNARTADAVRVHFFGKNAEADNDPTARLEVWVHCLGELDSEWVNLGGKDVAPNTSPDTVNRPITVEDCATMTVDGLMLQVQAGRRGDRKKRTVFLTQAQVRQGGSDVWTEDFRTP